MAKRPTPAPLADLPLRPMAGGVTLPVRVVPRSARDALDGVIEGALRVRLAAPPAEGAANRALLAFLAGTLGVPRRDLALLRGERGRHKVVLVRGLTADEVRRRLARPSG